MKHPVRFEGLGPSGMARRFGDERLDLARSALAEASERVGAAYTPPREGLVMHDRDFEAIKAAQATELENRRKDAAAAKEGARSGPRGGRPAKHSDKPWEAEGISRALWYRRRAGRKGADR